MVDDDGRRGELDRTLHPAGEIRPQGHRCRGPAGRCARSDPPPVSPRISTALGGRGDEPSIRAAVPLATLELEHDRRPREPPAVLLVPPRLGGVRRQRSGAADHVGGVRCAHDPARLRTRSDDPRPSTGHRQCAAVRDLAVPGLVRARGAGVLAPHARGNDGDGERRLPPPRSRTIGEHARGRLGMAGIRAGNDGRTPRAQHGRVPADREPTSCCWVGGGDTDAGPVVSCAIGSWPSSRCSASGAAGCGLPATGRARRVVLLDPAPDRGERAERRLRRLRRCDTGNALHRGGARGPRPGGPGSAELERGSPLACVRARSSASRRRSAS